MRIERTDISELGSLYMENVAGHDIDQIDEEHPYVVNKKPLAGEPDIETQMDEVTPRLSMEDEKDIQERISGLVTNLVAKGLLDKDEAEELAEETYEKIKDVMGY